MYRPVLGRQEPRCSQAVFGKANHCHIVFLELRDRGWRRPAEARDRLKDFEG